MTNVFGNIAWIEPAHLGAVGGEGEGEVVLVVVEEEEDEEEQEEVVVEEEKEEE